MEHAMWPYRRRDRLGSDTAAGLRHRLEVLEDLIRGAGLTLESAAADAVPKVPPSLIAASRLAASPAGEPVIVATRPGPVIAVVAPGGDPAEWMTAITAAAAQAGEPGDVARFGRVPLPGGLLAVAAGPAWALTVSSDLPPAQARAAARCALQAARRADRQAGYPRTAALLPAAGAFLATWRAWTIPAKTAAGAVAAVTTAAAVAAVAAVPGHGATLVPGALPGPPPPVAAGTTLRPGTAPHSSSPAPAVIPAVAPAARARRSQQPGSEEEPEAAASQPSPAQSPETAPAQDTGTSSPSPGPSPSPSVTVSTGTGTGTGICLDLLVLGACLNV